MANVNSGGSFGAKLYVCVCVERVYCTLAKVRLVNPVTSGGGQCERVYGVGAFFSAGR